MNDEWLFTDTCPYTPLDVFLNSREFISNGMKLVLQNTMLTTSPNVYFWM